MNGVSSIVERGYRSIMCIYLRDFVTFVIHVLLVGSAKTCLAYFVMLKNNFNNDMTTRLVADIRGGIEPLA